MWSMKLKIVNANICGLGVIIVQRFNKCEGKHWNKDLSLFPTSLPSGFLKKQLASAGSASDTRRVSESRAQNPPVASQDNPSQRAYVTVACHSRYITSLEEASGKVDTLEEVLP